MEQDTLGKLFVGVVAMGSILGTWLILGGNPVMTGVGVLVLIVGIISIIPALVLTTGTEA